MRGALVASTHDHKRIRHPVPDAITVSFFIGGFFAMLIRLDLLTPEGDLVLARHLQQALHHARRDHGFLLPDPFDSGRAGQLLLPMMIGARDLAFPQTQSAELVLYMLGGRCHVWAPSSPAASIPAGPSTRLTAPPISNSYVIIDRRRHLHRGLLLHSDRAELHRHHPPHARAGTDLVPAAAVRLVALRHQPDLGAGHAGAGDHACCWSRLERICAPRHLRSRAWRRSAAVPTPVLVLFASGRLHHDSARHGRGQRNDHLLLAQTASSAISFVAFASVAIAVLGFLVWGHHMFVAGQSVYAGLVFSFLSYFVAIPSAIKVFNWTATLYKGSISFDTPMLYASRLHRPVHHRRPDRPVPGRARAWTSTFTTPIS